MNLTKLLVSILILLAFLACQESKKDEITRLVKEWQGKEIIFPKSMTFTLYGKDTLNYKVPSTPYKILMYVDSFGCTSCKLQLPKWNSFIKYIDSLSNSSIPVIVVLHPKSLKEVQYLLRRDIFRHPVCVDLKDDFNKQNSFPQNSNFQTFLLNEKNKVIGIGNPIHNIEIKDLYLKQITNKSGVNSHKKTTFEIKTTHLNMGKFRRTEHKEVNFHIKNTGNSPLIILDSSTTCGCAATHYDPRPAAKGDSLMISVRYTPKDIGQFEEWITVKCNTEPQTIKLSVKGTVY